VIIGRLIRQPVLANLHWNSAAALLGIIASLPPLFLFVRSLKATWRPLIEVRQLLERTLGASFRNFSIIQLAMVSALAGVSEEVLFRVVVQKTVEQHFGPAAGLICASVLFGLVHLLTWTYGVITAIAGLYLGALWLVSGNLLAPILAHACYDFLALIWFLKVHKAGSATPHDPKITNL